MFIEKKINNVLMTTEIGIDDTDYYIRVGDGAHPEFAWLLGPVEDSWTKQTMIDAINSTINFFYPRMYIMDNSENVYSARAILDLAQAANNIELMMNYTCDYLSQSNETFDFS